LDVTVVALIWYEYRWRKAADHDGPDAVGTPSR